MAKKPATQSTTNTNGLAAFFKVKAGEGRAVFLVGFAIMATSAGYWLGGNSVEAIVLNKLGAESLPYLLIGKAVLAFFSISLYNVWLARVNRTRLLTVTSLLTFFILIGAWWLALLNPPTAFYYPLLPVTYIIPDLLILQAWSLAREVFDARQAKRVFPLISAVGVVGIVGGNFLTVPLTRIFQAVNMIAAWGILVLLAFFAMYTLRRELDKKLKIKKRRKGERARDDTGGMWERLKLGYTFARYYPIIGLLAFATALGLVLYWVQLQLFLQAATLQFGDADQLAGYLGTVNGISTLIASVIGLFLTNRLFATMGIRNVLLILPMLDLVSFGLLLLNAGTAPLPGTALAQVILFTRMAQMIAKEGIDGSANQTLYNLIPAETREVAETFNQAVSQQIGIGLAGLIVLLIRRVNNELILLCLLGLGLSLLYLWFCLRMRRQYRPTLVQLLREGQQDFFRSDDTDRRGLLADMGNSPAGDDPLTIAISNLQDNSEGTRRLSAELLGKIGAEEGIAPLRRAVLMDASPEVRRTAILALKEVNIEAGLSTIAEAMGDSDAGVRAEAAAALREGTIALNGGQPDPMAYFFLKKALGDSSPIVRREAALTMAAYGQKGQAFYVLWEMGQSSDAMIRSEAATGYGLLRDPVLVNELIRMMDDADPLVRRKAAASLSYMPSRNTIAILLMALEDDNDGVRDEAAHSLAVMRQYSGRVLLKYLYKTPNQKGQAAALHALSLAKSLELQSTGSERFADRHNLLVANAGSADADARSGRLALRSEVGFELTQQDEDRLITFGQNQINLAQRLNGYLQNLKKLDLPPIPSDAPLLLARRARRNPDNLLLLQRSLKERYQAAVLRAVNVIGLLGNVEAISLVANGLVTQGRNAARMRAEAIETLENVGDPRLTRDLVDLLETADSENAYAEGKPLSQILISIWLEGDNWLRACVLHVVGMFDLRRLRPLVDQVLENDNDETEADPWIEEAAMESLQRFEWPRDDRELNRILERSLLERDMQTLTTLTTMSRILFLQRVPIFANLSPEDLRRVALVSRERSYSPSEIICYEGDPGDELYIVITGRVQVIVGYGNNSQSVVAIKSEGESAGEFAIMDDIPRSATLRANGSVRLLTLGADEFRRILRERPELAVEVIRVLSRMVIETNKRVQSTFDPADNLPTQPPPSYSLPSKDRRR